MAWRVAVAMLVASLMAWLGFLAGRAFGWTVLESVFAGAIVAISSTTIIAKAFDEQGIRGRLREPIEERCVRRHAKSHARA